MSILAALLMTFSAYSRETLEHRVVFDIAEAPKVSIVKMQVDLIREQGVWVAYTKSLGKNGKKKPAALLCAELAPSEFNCERTDGGGQITVFLKPTPVLSVTYFSADDDGEKTELEILHPMNKGVDYKGKVAVIANTDAF